MLKFSILTLFPDIFQGVFSQSILNKAIEKNLLDIKIINIRDFAEDKHKVTDDYAFGGGPGMVMKIEPIIKALQSIDNWEKALKIYLTPQGKKLNQHIVKELALKENLILLCGRYEGVDERVIANYFDEHISIGDYILSGGEIPAMVLIDSISRNVTGVLGNAESLKDETFENNLLKYPVYTRPRSFNGLEVPEILVSGNTKLIEEWKHKEAVKKTAELRPDLIDLNEV